MKELSREGSGLARVRGLKVWSACALNTVRAFYRSPSVPYAGRSEISGVLLSATRASQRDHVQVPIIVRVVYAKDEVRAEVAPGSGVGGVGVHGNHPDEELVEREGLSAGLVQGLEVPGADGRVGDATLPRGKATTQRAREREYMFS